jgi:hypothetical protein
MPNCLAGIRPAFRLGPKTDVRCGVAVMLHRRDRGHCGYCIVADAAQDREGVI